MTSSIPPFEKEPWKAEDRAFLLPFFSNIDRSVYTIRNMPPELSGALSSRASRAKGDLRRVFLEEYIKPILHGEDEELKKELFAISVFFQKHNFRNIINNQRAQKFFIKWLAQYGDESIMQMVGTYLVFASVSNIAVKFLEDQRIGLAPIEKSTRYVDFSLKIQGSYPYYTPIELEKMKLTEEYRKTMDFLFDTYLKSLPEFKNHLIKQYPKESPSVLEKKTFDTFRGLLPMSTLTQVGFFGNAQAFEHLINRSSKHPLQELCWIGKTARQELDEEIPSLLLRQDDAAIKNYHTYLTSKQENVAQWIKKYWDYDPKELTESQVSLLEYDPTGEEKVISGILYNEVYDSWDNTLVKVKSLPTQEKREILHKYLGGRKERWQRAGRALENAYLRFEIIMNIGAWRDLHRHRMQTQARQLVSCHLGFDIPREIRNTSIEQSFIEAMKRADSLYKKIEKYNPLVAQYCVPLAYRVRFYQWCNLRQLFWETELRTSSQGHPDYRIIEQQKYLLVKKVYPLIAAFMKVDMDNYDLARRGAEKRIEEKEKRITKALQNKKQKH